MIEAGLRAATVPPFHAMAMSAAATERARAGRTVLHLEVGQPSTGLPERARRAVEGALDRPLGYTDAGGLPSLRHAIAERYHDVSAERVFVVSGASAGFTLGFLALFDAGARVAVVEPGYPCYRNTLLALGMEPVPIVVDDSTRWAPTPAALDAAGELDGIVLASPSNPTGTVLGDEALTALLDHCRRTGMTVIADEIYHGITDRPAPRVLDHGDAFVVNSFSKYFSMTGWRVGWIVVPDAAVDAVERLQQNLFICAPHVSQVAAEAALDATDELDRHVERYRANRSLVVDGLAAAGIDRIAPADGAFYVYAHVPHLTTGIGLDSMRLCRRWLEELDVCATPGIDFDTGRGHEYVRFSYAGSSDAIGEALRRLGSWRPRRP